MFSSAQYAQVQLLTFLSKKHYDKGRFAVSVDVIRKKNVDSVAKKRNAEEQVYVEHESVVGSCSPEIELPLKNKKCDIQFSISGALKPQSELEPGEDILEYSESLSECRRLLTLVPTYNIETGETATIKFKVDGKVKHSVTIHDVPTIKRDSSMSSSSSYADVRGPTDRQTSVFSNVSSQSFGSLDPSLSFSTDADGCVDEGTTNEHVTSSSGEASLDNVVESDPIPEDELPPLNRLDISRDDNSRTENPGSNNDPPANNYVHFRQDRHPVGPQAGPFVAQPQAVFHAGQAVQQQGPQVVRQMGPQVLPQIGPQVVPPVCGQNFETAYDKILCNESLSTLAWSLLPSDAYRLLIGLRVPNHVLQANKSNHPGDVVSANFQSFIYWRAQKRSKKQENEASNQHLYEDLLLELHDMGRKDLKVLLKRTLEANKKLEKNDFLHL